MWVRGGFFLRRRGGGPLRRFRCLVILCRNEATDGGFFVLLRFLVGTCLNLVLPVALRFPIAELLWCSGQLKSQLGDRGLLS